jgi:hypothetical protein
MVVQYNLSAKQKPGTKKVEISGLPYALSWCIVGFTLKVGQFGAKTDETLA